MTGQKRLKNAKVLVVGAGGLGSPALMYLAAAGVGTLGIVEFDEVDESNLQRQIIHGQSDIGRSKARVGQASRSRRSTRYVEVVLHEERLDSTNVVGDLRPVRPDRRRHRQLRDPLPRQRRVRAARTSRTCGARSTASTARRRLLGRARPVLPLPLPRAPAARHGAVVRRGRRARRAVRVDRLDPGQRGHQAAHRHRRPAGRPADGLRRPRDDATARCKVRKDPECAVCGKNPKITVETELIDYEAFCGDGQRGGGRGGARARRSRSRELKAMIGRGKDFYLVDVREPNEFEIVSIPGATLIPKDEILNGEALAELPQDKPVVLYCKTGAAVGRGARGAQGRRLLRRRARRRRRRRLGQPDRHQPPDVLMTSERAEHATAVATTSDASGTTRQRTGSRSGSATSWPASRPTGCSRVRPTPSTTPRSGRRSRAADWPTGSSRRRWTRCGRAAARCCRTAPTSGPGSPAPGVRRPRARRRARPLRPGLREPPSAAGTLSP